MKTITRILSAALLLALFTARPLLANGGNPRPPACWPGINCTLHYELLDGGDPRPDCFPGTACPV